MKKLFFLLTALITLSICSYGQGIPITIRFSDFPTYLGNGDSVWVPVVIGSTNRKMYGRDLGKNLSSSFQASLDAMNASLNNKADKGTTLTINGIPHDLSTNQSWSVAVGVPTTRTITINSVTHDLSTNPTWSIPIPDTSSLNTRINNKVDKITGFALSQKNYTSVDSLKLVGISSGVTAVPSTRTITINGSTLDFSANGNWNVGTVTNVATGYGLSGTVSTTGTLFLDSATLFATALRRKDSTLYSTKYQADLRMKISDTAAFAAAHPGGSFDTTGKFINYQNAINLRLKIADTAAMFAAHPISGFDTTGKFVNYQNAINARSPIISPTFQTSLNLVTPNTTLGNQIMSVTNNSVLRTDLNDNGKQRWFLNDPVSGEIGSIQYSTPGSRPGVLFYNASGTGRSQVMLNSTTGGIGMGATTGSSMPAADFQLTTNGNTILGTGSESTSGLLTMNSTTKGLLPPRMTATQRAAISSPATGLMVFDTDSNSIFQRSSSAWVNLGSSVKYADTAALVGPYLRKGLNPTKGILIGDSESKDTVHGLNSLDQAILYGIDTLQGFTIKNQAVYGNTIAQQDTIWQNDPNKATYDWIVVMVGLNDVWDYTESSATALARYQSLINHINAGKKAGAPIFVAAMQPVDYISVMGATNGPTCYAKWQQMNQGMLGRGSNIITGVDYRFDDHMWLLNDGVGSLSALYDNGDHIHDNNLGRAGVGRVFRNMIGRAGFFNERTLRSTDEFWNYVGSTNVLTPKNPYMSLGTATTGSLALGASTALSKFYMVNNSSAAGHIDFWSTGTSTASSGITSTFAFTPTFNEGGTASNNVFFVSPYYQGSGSGTHYLARFGTNTASNAGGTHTDKFTIDNAGNVNIAGNLTVSGTYPGSGGSIDVAPTSGSSNAVQSGGVFTALGLKAPLASPSFTGTVYTPQIGIGMTSGASAKLHVTNTSSSANNIGFWVTGQSTASSGINSAFALTPNWNETGSSGHNAIFISPYVQASGSGSNYIMRIGTNTAANAAGTHTDKWTLAENGNVVSAGTTNGASATEMSYLSGLTSNAQTQISAKEPSITVGTSSQYWRGDKTFQALTTSAVTEGTNLYFTNARAAGAISLTTTGSSGAATYNSSTGALNIPNYAGGGGAGFDSTTIYAKVKSDSIILASRSDSVSKYFMRSMQNMQHWVQASTNNSTTITGSGMQFVSLGATATARSVSSSTFGQYTRVGAVAASAAGAVCGYKNNYNNLWFGSAAGQGGFDFSLTMGNSSVTAAHAVRGYVIMTTTTGTITTEPSAGTNFFGFAYSSAGTNWKIFYNDASGTADSIDLGSNFPTLTTSADMYKFQLSAPGNQQKFYYQITNLVTGAAANGSVTTNIPTSSTFFSYQFQLNSGAATGAPALDFVNLYLAPRYGLGGTGNILNY